MINRNNVGGQRIRPGDPYMDDSHNRNRAIIGQFNDGMDRLNRERELTVSEQEIANDLNPNSDLRIEYTALRMATETLWQHALEKQQNHNNRNDAGVYTTDELGRRLIAAADRWHLFKEKLNSHR